MSAGKERLPLLLLKLVSLVLLLEGDLGLLRLLGLETGQELLPLLPSQPKSLLLLGYQSTVGLFG